MATGNLKSALRHRLKPRRNKKFVAMVKEKYPNLDLDHLLPGKLGEKKRNDFLLCPKPHDKHIKQHYSKPLTEEEFLEDFIKSLEIIFDTLEELL